MSFSRAEAYAKNTGRRRNTSVRATDRVKLQGGLNLVDSVDQIKPGELLVGKNYEPHFISKAYARVAGHEVFDGQPRPHLAEYWKVDLTDILGGPYTVGETVTAVLGTDTQTAVVALYVVNAESDDSGYIIISDLSDDIDDGAVWTGGTSGATATDTDSPVFQGEADEDEHDTAQLAAESLRRDVIGKVGGASGSGDVNGVKIFKDNVYAFRNDNLGASGKMWKATAAGWTEVALGYKIRFSTGGVGITIGDTLTGLLSGASCTVMKVNTLTGMVSGGDAVGYVITNAITAGPFTLSENLQVGGVTVGVFVSTLQQSLSADGKYKFRNYNFGGNTSSFAMYGVNGEDAAFEYDGTTFTLIETGMVVDTPSSIGVHRGQLLLAFPGGSLQHSGKNRPLSFQPVKGANEILAGDEITGFIEEIGDVSFVFTRNKTFRMEGFVQENIRLKLHNTETGAIANSIQRIGRSVYLDDRGFSSLPATDTFGDFASAQISVKIEPLVQQLLATTTMSDSVVHRGKSLYRCFFSNNETIVIGYSGNKVNGITTIDYGFSVTATTNGEIEISGTNNGEERVFLGSDDGYVYETDVGRNFNGAVVQAYIITAYHFSKSPEYSKRYRRATIYMEGKGRSSIKVSADYDYNEDPLNFETVMDRAVALGGGRYGIARHGAFEYSAASKTDIRVSMNSHARNVSMIFFHEEANEEPHTLFAIHYQLSVRRLIRS